MHHLLVDPWAWSEENTRPTSTFAPNSAPNSETENPAWAPLQSNSKSKWFQGQELSKNQIRTEKLSASKYGKYETLGMTQLDIEEKKLAEEMKHLARMEFVIDKVTHLTESIQSYKK